MKFKAVVFTLVVLFAACFALTGIASAKTVGIVMPTKSLERWNRDGDYLKQKDMMSASVSQTIAGKRH